MAEMLGIYKCEICGNMVLVLHQGIGELVCCGQPMKRMEEKTEDQGQEKHLPVAESAGQGLKVMVGSVPHPMLEEHHIEWIEVQTKDGILRKFLSPGEDPEAEFPVAMDDVVEIREYCNIHGLWSRKI